MPRAPFGYAARLHFGDEDLGQVIPPREQQTAEGGGCMPQSGDRALSSAFPWAARLNGSQSGHGTWRLPWLTGRSAGQQGGSEATQQRWAQSRRALARAVHRTRNLLTAVPVSDNLFCGPVFLRILSGPSTAFVSCVATELGSKNPLPPHRLPRSKCKSEEVEREWSSVFGFHSMIDSTYRAGEGRIIKILTAGSRDPVHPSQHSLISPTSQQQAGCE
jgi:hypothetical protein